MKFITVWQPWATLIMIGAKPWEFRNNSYLRYINGPKQIGERVGIQAGSRPVRAAEVEDLLSRLGKEDADPARNTTALVRDKAVDLLLKVRASHKYRLLPLGMALGTVVLGEPTLSCDLFKMNVADSDRGNFNWAWPVSDIRHFEPPFPMNGRQGFFDVSDASLPRAA